ncbi:MAG: RNA polymerase sigma factor [Saprospiraceae bacterium]|jgi:RNA polymerase sigma factor (sigma-70 family)|nr:RNA polymerase sigma factor [Saprospiraceae bacterium]
MSLDLIDMEHIALINKCILNDRKAQETLYKQYFPKMYIMCRRYTQDDDKICQIINDAFLLVFKNISKFESKGSFEGWIRRITFNSLADFFRKENKNMKFLLLEDNHPNCTNQSRTDTNDDYDDILSKINTLSGSFKEVFIKYAIEGYNHKEIGEKLQISEGTSKWYLSEARKKLQLLFQNTKASLEYGG